MRIKTINNYYYLKNKQIDIKRFKKKQLGTSQSNKNSLKYKRN